MRCFVAGGAGFIGSNLVRSLMKKGWSVTVFDNLSLGRKEFLNDFLHCAKFAFIKADLLDRDALYRHLKGHNAVFHLAASSDISRGHKETDLDLKNGFLSTFNILQGMQKYGIKKLVFTSSSSIYGKSRRSPFAEDSGPILPLSLYAASKAASEAYISAFCNLYGIQAWIFRLANIVGPNPTHGVIFDFIKKLKDNPKVLNILGDGKQVKPYLYAQDCIEGMLFAFTHAKERLNYFNLSCRDSLDVKTIAQAVAEAMGLKGVRFVFSGGKIGWPGDQSRLYLDPAKINAAGWKAKRNSKEAVLLALKDILKQGKI